MRFFSSRLFWAALLFGTIAQLRHYSAGLRGFPHYPRMGAAGLIQSVNNRVGKIRCGLSKAISHLFYDAAKFCNLVKKNYDHFFENNYR